MGKRILTGVIGVPLIILCIFGPVSMMYLLSAVIMGMLYYELEKMHRKKSEKILLKFNLAHGVIAFLLYCFITQNLAFILAILTVAVVIETVFSYPYISMRDMYFLVFSNLYCGWLPLHILAVRELNKGAWLLMSAFILVWVCDSGAYFAGRLFGKHKMAPRLSPNKTIEGAIGGILLAVLAGLILQYYGIFSLKLSYVVVLSAIIAFAAIIGDLFESYLKRSYDVKDSGNILPGHGGFADRFDSFIMVIPLYFYFFQWMMQ